MSHSLAQFNPELTALFLDALSEPSDSSMSLSDAKEIIDNTYDDLKTLAVFCYKQTAGKSLIDCYEQEDPTYGLVANTIVKLQKLLMEYEPPTLSLKIEYLPETFLQY